MSSNQQQEAKRRKTVAGEGSVPASASSLIANILELVLPFLSVDSLEFPNLLLVNKDMHRQCIEILEKHCHRYHPTLTMLMEPRKNVDNGQHREGGGQKSWLTYGRYRGFFQAERSRRPNVLVNLDQLSDYEMVLELSTLVEGESKVWVCDIQPLQYNEEWCSNGEGLGCTFCVNNDPTTQVSIHTNNMRARILMRRKSSGAMAVIINQAKPYEIDGGGGEWRRTAYRNEEELLFDDDSFMAKFRLAYAGNLQHRDDCASFDYGGQDWDASSLELRFGFKDGYQGRGFDYLATQLLRAIDHWTWF